MKVVIRNPVRKEIQLQGKRRVEQLLEEIGLNETFIVIRGRELLTRDDVVQDEDTVEIVSPISGG